MILGKPKDLNNYICVCSLYSLELENLGFMPLYREVCEDKIYFVKTQELCRIVNELGVRLNSEI